MLDAENPPENTPQGQTAENGPAPATPGEPPATDSTATDSTATDSTAAEPPAKKSTAKKTTAKKAGAKKTAAKKTTAKTAAAKKTAVEKSAVEKTADADGSGEPPTDDTPAPARKSTARKTAAKKTTSKKAAASGPEATRSEATRSEATSAEATSADAPGEAAGEVAGEQGAGATPPPATTLLFQAPDPSKAQPRRKKDEPKPDAAAEDSADAVTDTTDDARADQKPEQQKKQAKRQAGTRADENQAESGESSPSEPQDGDRDSDDDADGEQGGNRRRRRRGGRRRRKSENGSDGGADSTEDDQDETAQDTDVRGDNRGDNRGGSQGGDADSADGESASSRRRRRRRRSGEDGDGATDDPQKTVTRVRKQRSAEDEITAVTGSTRLEAKKQRRREGREAGRRRAPIASEAEFLARREAVERVMVIRQNKDLTQIAVLEDKVLVEHYVARESQTSLIGNVYLGRVQNVLPSMEAAFIDIGKGRNAVLYAGEVNWDSLGGKGGGQRKIEQVLKSGQSVLVQVTKDPIGHKGARLTSQVSLPGRFLVYVPDGTTSGISRKLPDTERNRLKTLLKEIVPETAGVIVRTAAEGASEEELTRDVERLTARWGDIDSKVNGTAPKLLYGEPDLTLKVVRDLFTEDFGRLVVSGGDAWDMVDGYVKHVAPELEERLERYDGGEDVFAAYRIDEQIAKGLDRKVWLPSGGSLIIDRTEAMTVVDVNTGKFTGSGGNLEETVTKNNLEAAEEMVRQLRLRDIGGIIVIDFIDMVLESNRDLVLRRMVECLGRDRTRHQVAEVTSLGLVQMTRKRIGTGLLEAFSESCEHCQGRGLIVHHEPLGAKKHGDDEPRRGRRGGRNRGRVEDSDNGRGDNGSGVAPVPSPKDVAAMAKPEHEPGGRSDEQHAGADPVTGEKPADQEPGSRRDGHPGEPPVADAAADEAPDAVADEAPDTVSDEASGTGAASPQPFVAKPEPAAPKVVSSVRRRGAARRPAGPPTGAAGPPTGAAGAATGPDGMGAVGAVARADGMGSADGTGTSDVATADLPADVPESPAAAHVPVKKKGSRKR